MMMTFLLTFACKCSFLVKSHHVMMTFLVFDLDVLFIKSHHVMMTFLVFDLDVLFIPCY